MLDALLISPHIDYFDSGKPYRTRVNIERVLPLGITGIAQFLHDSGITVTLVHLPASEVNDIRTFLARLPARLVLIQCHWFLYGSGAVKVARAYKDLFPQSLVYLGGYHSNYYAKEILAHADYVDGIIIGEGEIPVLRLIESLSKGRDRLHVLSGTIARSSAGEIRVNAPTDEDLLPMERIPVIKPDVEAFEGVEFAVDEYGSAAMSIERGKCAFKCNYCVAPTDYYRRENTTIPVSQAIEQMRVLQESGLKSVFVGECSFLHKEYVKELCTEMALSDLSINVTLETSPVLFEDPEMTKLLGRASILEFSLGVESGVDVVLQKLNRRACADLIMDTIEKIVSMKGVAFTSWIANVPGTTRSAHEENLVFLRNCIRKGAVATWINNLMTLPGTEYFENPSRHNIRLLAKTFIDWCRYALVAKQVVPQAALREKPEQYFTYVDDSVGFDEMLTRLFEMKSVASENLDVMSDTMSAAGLAICQKQRLLDALEQYESTNKYLVQM